MECQKAKTTLRILPWFLEKMIVSPAEVKVLWKLYNWKSIILLFWLGSRHQVHEALKFLYSESCPIKLLKAQYHTCGIAALSVSANSE